MMSKLQLIGTLLLQSSQVARKYLAVLLAPTALLLLGLLHNAWALGMPVPMIVRPEQCAWPDGG